jgi:peptide deformylase
VFAHLEQYVLMSIRKIITYPHPVLRQKAEKITVFDEELQTLIGIWQIPCTMLPVSAWLPTRSVFPAELVVVDRSTR